jgi:hypothetical protein
VTPILAHLLGVRLHKETSASTDEVSLSDVEERLRAFTSSARDVVLASKRNTIAAGALGAVATVAGAYLHGRRRGRRRATVIEVERK